MRLANIHPYLVILMISLFIALISIGIFVGILHAHGFRTIVG